MERNSLNGCTRWSNGDASHRAGGACFIRFGMITLRGVTKQYASPAGPFQALADVSLDIPAGTFTAIVGESGSGKSTLLSVMSGVERASSGSITVGTTALHTLSEGALTQWRGTAVGIVFQSFHLLPTLTVAENVMLPMDFCDRWPLVERHARAVQLLERLGVRDQADKRPVTLSGGQQQRVAIARALANAPDVLYADEPTGNLDSLTADQILELFASLVADGLTVVMVTHAMRARDFASRTIALRDGRILSDGPDA
jgi:putative ABC transport system ATP-binding protein